MSRGYGSVQRAIIAELEAAPSRHPTVEDLASAVYSLEEVGRSQLVSIRRAINLLEEDGRIHMCRVGMSGRRGWRYRVGLLSGPK